MSTSTRLAVATHVLAALALGRGTAVSSEVIARSANTNPAFVRRLLGALSKAGLTTSQLGQGGGALLARPAEEITLLDVHRALEEPAVFCRHEPSPRCPLGRAIAPILEEEMAEVGKAVARALSATTIADIAGRVATRLGYAATARVLGSWPFLT